MSTCKHDILLEKIEVDNICVLVGVVFRLELKTFLSMAVFVLKKKTIGVCTVEIVVKDLHLIESRYVAIPKSFGVGVFQGFVEVECGLLLNHLSFV